MDREQEPQEPQEPKEPHDGPSGADGGAADGPPVTPWGHAPGNPYVQGGAASPGTPYGQGAYGPAGYGGSADAGSPGYPGAAGPAGYGGSADAGYPGYPGAAGPAGYPGAPDTGYPGYPGAPAAPGYPGYPGYGPAGYAGMPGPVPEPGKGLGIGALVTGGLALLTCWIPFVNVVAILLGLVAVGLGIAATVKGSRAGTSGKPMGITAIVLGAVAAVVAVLINIALSAAFYSSVEEAPGPVADEPYPLTETEGYEDYSYDLARSTVEEILAAPSSAPGESATVGTYTVRLADGNLDATEEVLDRFPDTEEPRDAYALFTFTGTYNGTEPGLPWLDLQAEFVGADGRSYSPLSCPMQLDPGRFDQPRPEAGAEITREVCIALPPEALGPDARIRLQMVLAESDNEAVYWRLP